MTTVKEILAAANSLSASERTQLIRELWDSIPTEEWQGESSTLLEEMVRDTDAKSRGGMANSTWSEIRLKARREAGHDE